MRHVLPLPSLFRAAATVVIASLTVAASPLVSRALTPTVEQKDDTDASAPAKPTPSSEALKKEFTDTIEGQLAAFRAGDYAKAYTYAATPIKGMFTAEVFEKMVKSAYPVIANSRTVEFGLAFDVDDEAVISVRVENPEKVSVLYQYMLRREDGKWKINGVSEVKPTGLSV